jgi:serine phosphatase RsbU (regulator of sigma subunit)
MLQVSILPTDFTGYPATAIAASMRPALEMSGDFYDVFPVGNGRLGLVWRMSRARAWRRRSAWRT